MAQLSAAELLSAYLFEAEDFPGSEPDAAVIDEVLREAADSAELERLEEAAAAVLADPEAAAPPDAQPAGWWCSPDGTAAPAYVAPAHRRPRQRARPH
eukprot:15454390-Alexandrium_andersonii.AAC.3